jgi:hypothetical protein
MQHAKLYKRRVYTTSPICYRGVFILGSCVTDDLCCKENRRTLQNEAGFINTEFITFYQKSTVLSLSDGQDLMKGNKGENIVEKNHPDEKYIFWILKIRIIINLRRRL